MCDSCQDKDHDKCKGCTCQHRPAPQVLGVTGIESTEAVGDIGGN